MNKKIKITLIRSVINRPENQKLVVRGLGLKKLNQFKVLSDNPAVRGSIRKIAHLVQIEAVE